MGALEGAFWGRENTKVMKVHSIALADIIIVYL